MFLIWAGSACCTFTSQEKFDRTYWEKSKILSKIQYPSILFHISIEEEAFSIGLFGKAINIVLLPSGKFSAVHKIWLFGNHGDACCIPTIRGLDPSNCFHNFASHDRFWHFFFFQVCYFEEDCCSVAIRQRVIWSCTNINRWQIWLFFPY